jgi:glutamate--cysteine ligase
MIQKKDLIEYFFKGIKDKTALKIGVEHEKFALNAKTLRPLSYDETGGIKDIFNQLVILGWDPIKEGNPEKIIALKRNSEFITLEPGGQIELSGEPLNTIHQTCTETTNHLNELKKISNNNNFILLGIGVEPSLCLEDFPWMPKDRYSIMKKYMQKVGTLGHHMMKRSCNSQVNFDYISEQDMISKFRILLNFESIGTAIFANSPFDQGKPSEYKSLRSHFWHYTDKDRTGITPFVFDKNFNFETYTDYALNVPMYFIKRDNKYIDMTGVTFSQFLEGKKNENHILFEPEIKDWIDHLSTLFPQIRLKQYLEVRSMDACSWNEVCAPAAFWTGIIYDNESLNATLDLMKDWTNEDRLLLNKSVPKHGLNTKFQNKNVLDIAKELLVISETGLKRRNNLSTNKKYDETHYLLGLKENISKGVSPADILLEKYQKEWNESIDPIYKESIF